MSKVKTSAGSLHFQATGGWYRGEDGKDGKDGYTPIKGVDYWTEEDKEEIKNEIEDLEEIHVGNDAPAANSEALLWMIPNGTIEDSGFATKEYVDEAIKKIDISGPEVDLSGYVKKTDVGSNTALGLVKTLANGASYGVNINSSGVLSIVGANATDIANKSHAYKPLTPNNLDYAIEIGLTTNGRTLSAEKKAAAKAWLGIVDGSDYVLTEADKAEIAGLIEVNNIDLSDYYNKEEINNLLSNLPTGNIQSCEEVKF